MSDVWQRHVVMIRKLTGFLTLNGLLRLMDKILPYLKDPKLWELRYIPYYGSCRILSISRNTDFKSLRQFL